MFLRPSSILLPPLAGAGDVVAGELRLMLATPLGAVDWGSDTEATDDSICVVPLTSDVLDYESVPALVTICIIVPMVLAEREVP